MRVLVTGGMGYLGLALLGRLAGHHVVAYGRAPRSPAARAVVPPRTLVAEGELHDVRQAVRAHGPFDAVVHLAGGGGPRKIEADPVAAVETNVRATAALVEAARGARIVFASTIQVYGVHREPRGPFREEDGPAPDDLYGAVKAAAEQIVVGLAGGVALRIANIYGAGAGVDLGLQGAAERFARAAATGGELTLYGGGRQKIDYVHVDDVVDAIRAALERPDVRGTVNIGGGAPVTIAELARRCVSAPAAAGSGARIVEKPAPDGKLWPDRSLAIDRAAALLGWRPRRTLDEGIPELVAMMKKELLP